MSRIIFGSSNGFGPCLFPDLDTARVILSGIEIIHMVRKGQVKHAHNLPPSLAGQFHLLAA